MADSAVVSVGCAELEARRRDGQARTPGRRGGGRIEEGGTVIRPFRMGFKAGEMDHEESKRGRADGLITTGLPCWRQLLAASSNDQCGLTLRGGMASVV